MKNIIVIIISCLILGITLIFVNPVTEKLARAITHEQKLVIKPTNEYTKKEDYKYVKRSTTLIPYSYQDLLDIYYTIVDNGWEEFTFYCPSEYTSCTNDVSSISQDDLLLTHLNNFVHPFNSFTNLKSIINDSGEISIKITHLYNEDTIKKINNKVDSILKEIIKSDMDNYDKIKTVHDYIVNNVKYDEERNEKKTSKYSSFNAYGPLFEGYATCNGYTDLMAIFLSKMGFNNYKVATTPDQISYSQTGHIWNGVNVDGKWLHIDLTWDDPVSSDKKDYLFHTYFLVDTEAMKEADNGETVLEEHKFNPKIYLEFK